MDKEWIEKQWNKLSVGWPTTHGESIKYEFPQSLENLSLFEIGEWNLKIAAWEGYALAKLGFFEAEINQYQSNFDIGIWKYSGTKKLSKSECEYAAISQDENLQKMKSKILELESITIPLTRLIEAYKRQREAISRELTRRSLENAV